MSAPSRAEPGLAEPSGTSSTQWFLTLAGPAPPIDSALAAIGYTLTGAAMLSRQTSIGELWQAGVEEVRLLH